MRVPRLHNAAAKLRASIMQFDGVDRRRQDNAKKYDAMTITRKT